MLTLDIAAAKSACACFHSSTLFSSHSCESTSTSATASISSSVSIGPMSASLLMSSLDGSDLSCHSSSDWSLPLSFSISSPKSSSFALPSSSSVVFMLSSSSLSSNAAYLSSGGMSSTSALNRAFSISEIFLTPWPFLPMLEAII